MLVNAMTRTTDALTMRMPDDFHVHLRQDAGLAHFARATAAMFGRALVMPNTLPPVTTSVDVERYRREILNAVGDYPYFAPLMSFKLTDPGRQAAEIPALQGSGVVTGKFYPRGATTHSEDGITDFRELYPVFEAMQAEGIVLSVHAEDPGAFILEREREFLPVIRQVSRDFPKLKIIVEHVSSAEGVEAVLSLPETVGATITLHHLMLTLDDLLGGKLQPHLFCKPVVKRPADREALREAIRSGNSKFFFGSDSAPHPRSDKEGAECGAGVYTAPVALPALVLLFESLGMIERLEDFVSGFGADFYGLPRSSDTITLVHTPWTVPEEANGVVPFLAGQTLPWQLAAR